MTFREQAHENHNSEAEHLVPAAALATEEETPPATIHDDEVQPVPEEALTPLPAKGEDPVRLYLKEIGKVPLLTAQQEVQIGRRIDALAKESRRNRTTAPAKELKRLESEAGLLRKQLQTLLAEIETSDRTVRQAKRELMEANLRLVVSVAKRYLGSDLSLLDLVQEGNIGLMKAVDRFQYRRGFKFSTYATWWIRQAITRAIADHS